jgi:hypothetical protein
MQVLEPAAKVSIGTLYILDDGSDVAIVRPQGESPDLWIDPIAYMRIAAALLPTKVRKMGLN